MDPGDEHKSYVDSSASGVPTENKRTLFFAGDFRAEGTLFGEGTCSRFGYNVILAREKRTG
jgi:hypothetical protein